jgi:hypothetical protein
MPVKKAVQHKFTERLRFLSTVKPGDFETFLSGKMPAAAK